MWLPKHQVQITLLPDDYYFLAERQATINNANLRMEKAINYTLGYQQKISDNAGMTIEAYYRKEKIKFKFKISHKH